MYTIDPFRALARQEASEARQEAIRYSAPDPVEPNDDVLSERDFPIGEDDTDTLTREELEFLASLQFPFFPER